MNAYNWYFIHINYVYRPFILRQILTALSSSTELTEKKTEEVILDFPSDIGYEVVYSKLMNASKPDYDPLQGIVNCCVF